MRPRDIPNALCVLRMLLVAPVVWLLLAGEYAWVLVVFFLAGFTDGLDGFLAKRFDWRSRLGGILDPLADKLLLVTSFLTLGYIGLAPVWLLIMVVARDVIIVSGATA
ncbi:MAG: CDP-alcohol phosphatidyltransferase family protein, partial [Gammaproteobacteria bacterium]